MGELKPKSYYNRGYKTNPKYALDEDHAPWSQLWHWIAAHVGAEPIIDLGCGAGHFAALLARRGHPAGRYLGIDFSIEAIRLARRRVPSYRFIRGSLPKAAKKAQSMSGAVVVACEVLEHIHADRAVIKHLPAGTRMLGTLPRRDSASHVRFFPRMHLVLNRYKNLLDFQLVECVGNAYAFDARRRVGVGTQGGHDEA